MEGDQTGLSNLIALVVLIVLLGPPIWKIFRKTGLTPAWGFLIFTGIGYPITLAVLGFKRWVDDEEVR